MSLYPIPQPSCLSPSVVSDFARYTAEQPWRLVSFRPRTHKSVEQADLMGWWLPVQDPLAPRVVVCHGQRQNFDAPNVQMPAFMLRTAGLSALAVSVRDHGLSQVTSRHTSWGFAYPFDLLGAWDFAVEDPLGVLGGALPAGRVGLMAFSRGGFSSAIAFGLEPAVPALWLDHALFDHGSVVQSYADYVMPGLGWVISRTYLLICELLADGEVEALSPRTALDPPPGGPSRSRRPVALIGNVLDLTLPHPQYRGYRELLGSRPDLYELRVAYEAEYQCGGSNDLTGDPGHMKLYAWRPSDYQQLLCGFFAEALGLGLASCDSPPRFPQCNVSHCDVPP